MDVQETKERVSLAFSASYQAARDTLRTWHREGRSRPALQVERLKGIQSVLKYEMKRTKDAGLLDKLNGEFLEIGQWVKEARELAKLYEIKGRVVDKNEQRKPKNR
ncbi:hypothetical protein ABEW34_01855 [Paenibacillus algorifonticola]|uniref:hypothetical protein n=1 Tax=Paenibacillus algorifonticola TaxID=684063 RepID=UPI003D2C56C8